MPTQTSYVNAIEVAGDWSDPTYLLGAHDETCAYSVTASDVSGEYSFAFTGGSAIPDGATINGIQLDFERNLEDTNDLITHEVIDSTSTWRALDCAAMTSGGATCDYAQSDTLGGAAILWGGTWTAAWINSTDFRVRLTFKAVAKAGQWVAEDYILCTVTYTEAPVGGTIQPLVDDGTIQLTVDDGTIQKIVD